MQQTRLETDTLAPGMAKEVDSAGVATVRTREGEMAAERTGACPAADFPIGSFGRSGR